MREYRNSKKASLPTLFKAILLYSDSIIIEVKLNGMVKKVNVLT